MNKTFKSVAFFAAMTPYFLCSAQAQDTPWWVRVGPAAVNFSSSAVVKVGGGVVPGASANADTNYTLAVEIGRNLTPNWAVGLTLGLPPTAKLYGTGSAAPLGELGRAEYGPAVLSLQYQFNDLGAWHPYLGLGVNRTTILDAPDGALKSLNVDSAWGSVVQAGAEYDINQKIFAFIDLKKIFLKTNATGTLGGAPVQARVTLNPLITTIGLGWRF